jgi:hypothetical protein
MLEEILAFVGMKMSQFDLPGESAHQCFLIRRFLQSVFRLMQCMAYAALTTLCRQLQKTSIDDVCGRQKVFY